MIFSRIFGRKRKQNEIEELIEQEKRYVALETPKYSEQQVVDMCELLIDCARDYEDAKEEYDIVTYYLNDVQTIEELPEASREEINEIATNVSKLNIARDEFLKTEHKLSDAQFAQMQEMEDEIPKKINRLKENEEDLAKIKRDLDFLEGEKTSWKINKEDSFFRQKQLRNISIILLIVFGFAVVFLLCF